MRRCAITAFRTYGMVRPVKPLETGRWWLFTMTNAATGHALHGKNKGWRKAVRFALTENPVSSSNRQERQNEMFRLVAAEGRLQNGHLR